MRADGSFTLSTGLAADHACFALWHGALPREAEILADIAENFEVIADFRVHWSDRHYNRNIARLYQWPRGHEDFAAYCPKIGPTPFRFILVRDRTPSYAWKRSVSGVIEPSNERVVAAKYRYRALFEKPFQVHSSINVGEFVFQCRLVLGNALLDRVFAAPHPVRDEIHKDLEGADGWDNWRDLFAVLDGSVRYLVLRNFDGLPDALVDGDIDFLCDQFQPLASAANIWQRPDRPYKGVLKVGGRDIPARVWLRKGLRALRHPQRIPGLVARKLRR